MKKFLAVALILAFIIALGACSVPSGSALDPTLIAYVEQTQTATMLPHASPTPSPSAVPKQVVIVNALNTEIRKEADPLEETLDAKFSILDIVFDSNDNSSTTIMEVHVECEWIKRSSCTEQRAFVVLANAFKRMKPGIRKKIKDEVPVTIKTVLVRAFDHMTLIGMIEIDWEYLWAFANGNITGEQLAARALQLPHP
ncbi:MAG: hypothetical protein WA821_09960 [Anaerolineales bacterium]